MSARLSITASIDSPALKVLGRPSSCVFCFSDIHRNTCINDREHGGWGALLLKSIDSEMRKGPFAPAYDHLCGSLCVCDQTNLPPLNLHAWFVYMCDSWAAVSAIGARLCTHTKRRPVLLSILSDLCFLCHVKTVTGVLPEAKTLYHCLPLYLSVFIYCCSSQGKKKAGTSH